MYVCTYVLLECNWGILQSVLLGHYELMCVHQSHNYTRHKKMVPVPNFLNTDAINLCLSRRLRTRWCR